MEIQFEKRRERTIASVDQVRPNDHFLRETEDTKASSLKGRVENIARVGDHVFTLKDAKSDQVDLRSMK